jgi:hypothetical protein
MRRRPARPYWLKKYTTANTLTINTPHNLITARPGILPDEIYNPYRVNFRRQAGRVFV